MNDEYDDIIIRIGKYKNKTLNDLLKDKGYVRWVQNTPHMFMHNSKIRKAIDEYIINKNKNIPVNKNYPKYNYDDDDFIDD
jgi:hypothetical protein